MLVLASLLYAEVAGITKDSALFTVQQFAGRHNVMDIGSSGVDVDVIRDVFTSAMSVYHEDWNRQVVEMNEATQQLQQAFASIGEQTGQMQSNVMNSVKVYDQSIEKYFSGLQQGLENLNSVLTELGQHQVVVQQVDPPKKGWFRRG